jgi:YcxB-like protein
MDLQFRWTESDYIAAQCAWILQRPWKIIGGYWYSLTIICIVVIALVVKPQNWRVSLIYLSVAVAAAIPGSLITWWRWHRQYQKYFSPDVDIMATVDEGGVTLKAKGEQKTHSWAEFSRVYESSRVVVLEKAEGDLLFLPKSAISSGQLAELKRLAESTPNCKVSLSPPLA